MKTHYWCRNFRALVVSSMSSAPRVATWDSNEDTLIIAPRGDEQAGMPISRTRFREIVAELASDDVSPRLLAAVKCAGLY
jgi:hypothetical protein